MVLWDTNSDTLVATLIHTAPNYKELGQTHQSEANTDGNGSDSHCRVRLSLARCGAGVHVWPFMVWNCEEFGCTQRSEAKPGSNCTDSYYAVTFGTLRYQRPHLATHRTNCEEFGEWNDSKSNQTGIASGKKNLSSNGDRR